LTLGASGIFDVMSDENEFVRNASLLVQQNSFKTHSLSSTIRNTRTRLFSALTAIDHLLLHIESEGRLMDSQGATSNGEQEIYSTQARKARRRTVLGVTGGVLAILIVASVVFSWLAVTQKFPFAATSQKKSLDTPLLTTINQMRNPTIRWSSDSHYLIESDPYSLEDATLVNIQTEVETQRNVFGIVANQSLSGNGVGAVPETYWTANGHYLVNENLDDSTGQITIEVWNVVAGQKMLTISYQDKAVIRVATNSTNNFSNIPNLPPAVVSPDNASFVLGKSDGTIEIWNISTGRKIATYKGDTSAIQGIRWYAHGQKLLSESKSGGVQIWDVATSKRILLFHPPLIKETSYTYSSSGQTTAQQITVPAGVDISPDGTRMVAVSDKNAFQMWDATTGQSITTYTFTFPRQEEEIDTVYWLQDNMHLVVVTSSPNLKSREIRILDGDTHHGGLSTQIAPDGGYYFSPSEKYLATVSIDKKSVTVWDVATGQPVSTYHNATTINGNTVWSPDEHYVATMSKTTFKSSLNNTIQVWDARTGQVVATYHSHSNQVSDVQWSPDGKYLATLSSADVGNVFEVWQASK